MNPLSFVRSLARLLAGRPQVPPALAENALLQTIYRRRSIRSFTADPVRDDELAAILEAGRLAPSTVNLQSWSFAVFTADTWRETFGRPIPFRAQRAVIVLGDMHRMRALLPDFPTCPLVDFTTAVMNASLAAMSMNLAAEALGISSVMLSETGRSGLLDAGYLKEVLGLPEQVFPLTTIAFGRARGLHPPMPPKLPLEIISFQGRYAEPDPAVLHDWLDQMTAGYKAMRPTSSLEDQLQVYESKVEQAEVDLRRIVFGDGNSPVTE
ncbi:MAG TPA: nitroreductase family protein [Anaerolineaceae bacterium]|nr:nitroreductase family protein [Anaerolineaceae bacterium]